MNTRTVTAIATAVLIHLSASPLASADASFESTSQITGGALIGMVKQLSFLGKSMNEMLEPVSTLTLLQGNRRAVVNKNSTEIVDLDKEVTIHIDNVKKTYTVITFAEMRQAFASMSDKIGQARAKAAGAPAPKSDLKTTVDVSVKNTGVSKLVNGLLAQEQILKLTTTVTDPNASAAGGAKSGSYVVTTDAWIAPDPPQVKEIQDFELRAQKKMMQGVDMSAYLEARKNAGAPPMGALLAGKPGAAEAMKQMNAEREKLKGTHVLEIITMGGGTAPPTPNGTATASVTPAAATPPPGPAGSTVAGQIATDTATQTAAQTAAANSSKLGVFGSALTSSALNAFRRAKPAPAPATPAALPPGADTAATAGNPPASAALMTMTVQKTNFSADPVPSSVFEVPAGFTKTEANFGARPR